MKIRPSATRTWPYGATYEVVVSSIEECGDWRVVGCVQTKSNGDKEGFVLIDIPHSNPCEVGDVRRIVFIKGGPTGGYWKLTVPSPGSGAAP